MDNRIKKYYLSRHVVVDDVDFGLSIVIINEDGSIEMRPFDRESHSTRYVDRPIVIVSTAQGKIALVNGKPL